MIAPVALRTLGGLYFGDSNPPQKANLLYTSSNGIQSIFPNEGTYKGGNLVTLKGNFSIFIQDEILVRFGETPVLSIEDKTETQIVIRPAGVTLEEGEDRRRVEVSVEWIRTGLVFQNSTTSYQYKNYSIVTGIWPESGPSSGGTLIEVRGQDFDQEPLCWLKAEGESII